MTNAWTHNCSFQFLNCHLRYHHFDVVTSVCLSIIYEQLLNDSFMDCSLRVWTISNSQLLKDLHRYAKVPTWQKSPPWVLQVVHKHESRKVLCHGSTNFLYVTTTVLLLIKLTNSWVFWATTKFLHKFLEITLGSLMSLLSSLIGHMSFFKDLL